MESDKEVTHMKFWKHLQGKSGFISAETMIVAAMLLALSVFALTEFTNAGVETTTGLIDENIIFPLYIDDPLFDVSG